MGGLRAVWCGIHALECLNFGPNCLNFNGCGPVSAFAFSELMGFGREKSFCRFGLVEMEW